MELDKYQKCKKMKKGQKFFLNYIMFLKLKKYLKDHKNRLSFYLYYFDLILRNCLYISYIINIMIMMIEYPLNLQ